MQSCVLFHITQLRITSSIEQKPATDKSYVWIPQVIIYMEAKELCASSASNGQTFYTITSNILASVLLNLLVIDIYILYTEENC